MNKKVILRNAHDKIVAVVLSDEISYTEQLYEVFAIHKGYGMAPEWHDDCIRLVDIFHGETRAEFPVLSITDCTDPVSLVFTELSE